MLADELVFLSNVPFSTELRYILKLVTTGKKLEQYIAQVDFPDILRKFLRNKLAHVFRQLCATCSASNLRNKMASQYNKCFYSCRIILRYIN